MHAVESVCAAPLQLLVEPRDRTLVPPPHGALHAPHEPQGDQHPPPQPGFHGALCACALFPLQLFVLPLDRDLVPTPHDLSWKWQSNTRE